MHIKLLVATLVVAACGKVSGIDQKADAVIIDWQSPNKVAGEPPVVKTEKLWAGTIEKGADHRVPVTVEWTVVKDANGCLQIPSLKISRTGGPTSTELYKPTVKVLGNCGKRDPSSPESFQQLSVGYCWRWSGAGNKDECAYSSAFIISGDAVGLEGSVDRQK